MLMYRRLLLLSLSVLVTAGCTGPTGRSAARFFGYGRYLSPDAQEHLHPDYRYGKKALPGPAHAVGVIDCEVDDPEVERNPKVKRRYELTYLPQLTRTLGQGSPTEFLRGPEWALFCSSLGNEETQWGPDVVLGEQVRQVLAGAPGKRTLLLATATPAVQCREVRTAILGATGEAVGSVGTGRHSCWQPGGVYTRVALLSETGEMLWTGHNKCGSRTDDDASQICMSLSTISEMEFEQTEFADIFFGLPQDAVSGTPVVQAATP